MHLEDYRRVQGIAKKVHAQLSRHIAADSTEQSIAQMAAQLLTESGAAETWYYDVPAMVLLGSRSCASLSGADYVPANEPVGMVNLVTVDLSPKIGSVWGDCARSYVIENGRVVDRPGRRDFAEGLAVEKRLHSDMMAFVNPRVTFSELFQYANDRILSYGFENLDFAMNLGHSIEVRRSDRRFIDSTCAEPLGSVSLFTFEPHVRKTGGHWGFKHEDIYYFDSQGRAVAL